MTELRPTLSRAPFPYRLMLILAAFCLAGTVLLGLFLGLASAFPIGWVDPLAIRSLRPLHTLMALSWLWFSIAGGIGLFCGGEKTIPQSILAAAQAMLLVVFLVLAAGNLLAGHFSGREYLGWPDPLNLLLIPGLGLSAVVVLRGWTRLRKKSTEAAWLILIGTLLLPLGLLEALGYHFPFVALDPGRDLTLQWHALDSVIAGWMICLFGLGILAMPGRGKPMRSGWLFGLAAIGILLDFGHHNYPSPEPSWIKIMSFTATMLAVVSFYRHLRTARKFQTMTGLTGTLYLHIEGWTLFAVGTGILMAVPWLNAYVHGTYVIVAHTMGSMIGVNSLLAAAVVYRLSGAEGPVRSWIVRTVSYSNLVLVLALTGLGLARGILRIDAPFHEWIHIVRPWYVLIPLAGLPLTIALLALAWDLARLSLRRAEF